MDLNRLRMMLAAPLAGLFVVLVLCVLAVRRPEPAVGIWIPMMKLRSTPLSNCEFNGFTVYLRSGGKFGGGDRDAVVQKEVLLSRIREARDDIQDDTIFIITDPDVPYGQFVELIADVRAVAPPDHIAVVTNEAQVEMVDSLARRPIAVAADRCRFEWPAMKGQPKWPDRKPISLPGGKMAVWEALAAKGK